MSQRHEVNMTSCCTAFQGVTGRVAWKEGSKVAVSGPDHCTGTGDTLSAYMRRRMRWRKDSKAGMSEKFKMRSKVEIHEKCKVKKSR